MGRRDCSERAAIWGGCVVKNRGAVMREVCRRRRLSSAGAGHGESAAGASRGIEVLQVRIAEPAPAEVLAHLARVCAGGLPAGLADFYGELDGFFVDWVQTSAPDRPGAEPASGRINVRPAAEVFGPGPGLQFLDEDVRFRPVRPDIFTSEACGAFLQGPDMAVSDELHLHVFGEGTSPPGTPPRPTWSAPSPPGACGCGWIPVPVAAGLAGGHRFPPGDAPVVRRLRRRVVPPRPALTGGRSRSRAGSERRCGRVRGRRCLRSALHTTWR